MHRTDCTNAGDLQSKPERLVEVEWASAPGAVFLVAIQVEALDRHRLLSDVTKALADERVNILSASVQTSRDRVAVSRFTFELADPAHLGAVLQTVRNVDGRLRRRARHRLRRRTGVPPAGLSAPKVPDGAEPVS